MTKQRRFFLARTRHWLKVASVEWGFIETIAREDLSSDLAFCERALVGAREAGGERTFQTVDGLDALDDSQLAPSELLEELLAPLDTHGNEYAVSVLEDWDGAAVFSIQQAKVTSVESQSGPEERRRQEALVNCVVAWSESGLRESAGWWLRRIFPENHMPSDVEGPVQHFAKVALSAPDPVRLETKGAALPMLLTMEPAYYLNSVSFNAQKRDWLRRMTCGFAWALIGDTAVYEKLKLADGSSYEGEHQNGSPHGSGEQTWPDGRRFRGDFRNGLPHGLGTLTWPTGDRLESRWRKGRSRGTGVMTLPNGMSYRGDLLFGRQHGKWTTTAPDGRKVVSHWFLGKRLSSRRLS